MSLWNNALLKRFQVAKNKKKKINDQRISLKWVRIELQSLTNLKFNLHLNKSILVQIGTNKKLKKENSFFKISSRSRRSTLKVWNRYLVKRRKTTMRARKVKKKRFFCNLSKSIDKKFFPILHQHLKMKR